MQHLSFRFSQGRTEVMSESEVLTDPALVAELVEAQRIWAV
jgi:hypothetical protein